jgi:hypothetical protein
MLDVGHLFEQAHDLLARKAQALSLSSPAILLMPRAFLIADSLVFRLAILR